MNRQRASRLPRRSSIQISNQWQKQAVATADPFYNEIDPKKWFVKTQTFDGKFRGGFNKEEVNGQLITDGVEKFKKNPVKYMGIMYKTEEMNNPKCEQGYALILREKGSKVLPADVGPDGRMTIMTQEYRRLPPLKNNALPKLCRDEYTDDMIYKGKKLHTKSNKPLMPGRGMGLLDQPSMKLIGTVDPSDVKQGLIADCWLLSGISTLAEFEGGIQRLFRKTKKFETMPFDDRPNMYTITLWDISTWTEIDIVVDERLCSRPDSQSKQGEQKLLGAKPSDDGELWVPYLEKAVSIHCGGWDKISYGANCNHAWAILTGVKEQCTILRVGDENTNWGCYAKYDPFSKTFAELDNDPWKGFQSVWSTPWPDTEGGSFDDFKDHSELTDVQLFGKMCDWDDGNFLMACSSKGASDLDKTDGIVNKHAYGVVECKLNVAGTGLDMIQLRNPWGKGGELENGQFARGKGSGWKKYPQLKRELNPDQDSPGVFWLTRQEFFKYYDKIYLSAGDMSEFLGLTPPKPKRDKPKDEKEMETDTKKRKVEIPNEKQTNPNVSASPVKKTKAISKQASPKKASPIKAKPKGFVKVEKNIPKRGKGKKGASGFFKAIPSSKGGGFKKMIPRNKKEETAQARLEAEKKQEEKLEKERQEKEKLERERQEKLEQEKQERQRLEREQQAKAKQERDRIERERKATLKLEKQERDKLDRESKAQERQEKQERDRLERERKAQEKLERESLQREKKEQERLEKERKAKESKDKSMRSAKKLESANNDTDRGKQEDSMELQEKDAIIANLQRRLDEAETETTELRSRTTTLNAIQEDLEDEVMVYEEQLETKSGIIDTLTDELNQAYEAADPEENAKELREKNADLREKAEELSNKNAEISKLRKELAKARSSALSQSDQKTSVMQHRREIEEKNSIIASMRKEVNNGKRRISALQDQASELESTKQELESDNKRQKRKIEKFERDDGGSSSFRADLQKAKRTIQNLSQSKSQSQRDLAQKDKRVDFLRSELREANKAIQSLERKVGGSRDRDRVNHNQLKKRLEDMEAELDSKDAKLKSAERAGVESRKRLREKDDHVSSVLNQLQQSRKEVRGLQEKNEGVVKKLKSNEHHVSFLDTQLEEAKHLIQTLEQRNRAFRDRETARLRKQLQTKQEEANTQKHQLQQAKDSAQTGRMALRAKEQESIELRGALRQLRQEFQSLEQEKSDIYARENRKLKQLQSRLNTTQAALETEREKRKHTNDRVGELEEELHRERNKRQRLYEEEQATERSPNEPSEAGQLLKEKEEELNFMGKKLRRMTMHQQQSSRHLEQEMTQKEDQVSDLEQQVDDLQRENEALYEKNATQKSQNNKLHELEIELDKEKSIAETWREDVASLKATVDEQKNHIERMDMEIADKDTSIQLLEQKIAEQDGVMTQKSTASAKHAKAIADLNKKLETAQEQLKRRRIESTSEGANSERMDELERELWDGRNDSDSLRHTIKLQEAKLEEKEALIESLTRRLKERSQEPSLTSERAQEREPSLIAQRVVGHGSLNAEPARREREPSSTAERVQEPTSAVERAREPSSTGERVQVPSLAAVPLQDPSATAARAREPSLTAERAQRQRSSAQEDHLYHTGDAKTKLEPDQKSAENQEKAKRVRATKEMHLAYDTLPRKTSMEPAQDSPDDQQVDGALRTTEYLQPEYDTRLRNSNFRNVLQKEKCDDGRGYSHMQTPDRHNQAPDEPEYESRAKSDPPAGGMSTETSPGKDHGLNTAPSHLNHLDPLYLQSNDENRATRGGFDEPEGVKWDGDVDASRPRTEIEDHDFIESKSAEEHKWNEKSDLQSSQLRDESRMKNSDLDESSLAYDEEMDVHMVEPREESGTVHADFADESGMDEEKWHDASRMSMGDNRRTRNRDFGVDEEKWPNEPRMHALHTRDERRMNPGDYDEAKALGDEKWNDELDMGTSNPREYRRTKDGDYYASRAHEEKKWNEEPDMMTSTPSHDKRMRQHRGFDEPMDMSDEKWNEDAGLQTSGPHDWHRMRRDDNEPRPMEDGKWNDELGIYIKPTPASRSHQETIFDPYVPRSGRNIDYAEQKHMESSTQDNSPWYYDSQPPIGDWHEGWDSNLRRQTEDHAVRREAHDARRLQARSDREHERRSAERGAQPNRYGDGDSDQFTSNAHIIGSMNSWAESTGSRQQQIPLSRRVQGKQEGGADSINDYLARLFEKVQATKSELEATQKRLNHTVGRHLVHE